VGLLKREPQRTELQRTESQQDRRQGSGNRKQKSVPMPNSLQPNSLFPGLFLLLLFPTDNHYIIPLIARPYNSIRAPNGQAAITARVYDTVVKQPVLKIQTPKANIILQNIEK
jgi:hypothetical protein